MDKIGIYFWWINIVWHSSFHLYFCALCIDIEFLVMFFLVLARFGKTIKSSSWPFANRSDAPILCEILYARSGSVRGGIYTVRQVVNWLVDIPKRKVLFLFADFYFVCKSNEIWQMVHFSVMITQPRSWPATLYKVKMKYCIKSVFV